ncbi:hypothetical protein F4775DRAFT_592678 [Biscogniauxia sp. FL1348]|nr:hypothetical protein F4775DRAFT_592678 [Biscogniauxia sp. FL1348]
MASAPTPTGIANATAGLAFRVADYGYGGGGGGRGRGLAPRGLTNDERDLILSLTLSFGAVGALLLGCYLYARWTVRDWSRGITRRDLS